MITLPERIHNILVIQTAFIGDAVLTLPMIQVLHRHLPHTNIDVVVVPRAAELFRNHPAIREVIPYDKRSFKGIVGYFSLRNKLRSKNYGLAIVPHRSLRSAMLVKGARIPDRIGFDTSASPSRFTDLVQYRQLIHESDRNLSLLKPLGIVHESKELPELYPSRDDTLTVEKVLRESGIRDDDKIVAIAPGTIWNTKRWLKERFAALAKEVTTSGYRVVLVGGPDDALLCEEIAAEANNQRVFNAAGKLSLLQSAALIQRSRVLVSNDSAPMHMAVAMRTPVVAIFGATIPEFGFAPYGTNDIILETKGLPCRPCSIHGGNKCPIKTFDCMNNITVDDVFHTVQRLVNHRNASEPSTR